ncbi:MAG: FecR domain-containing protein [Paucimonas sp.]|jgi:transmembrane sensor|nr:FecR domain-containing protein [Paucimonas sp.]
MNPAPPDHATLQQAADWYARINGQPHDPALQQAWQHWLAQDEGHRQAWGLVERVSQRFAPLHDDVEDAAQTLDHLRRQGINRRRLLRGVAGVVGLGFIGLFAWRPLLREPLLAWQADLRSATGEIVEHRLADGTRLWLASDSAVDVHFNARQRNLRLYRGEVLVSTAADPRPLFVHTAHGSLQPLGTRFSVSLDDGNTRLTVFEGRVLARCAGSSAQQEVAAGHALAFDSQHFTALQPASPAREAWSRGVLLAEDIPLARFVAELGRYRHGYLGVDPALAELKIMGTFPLHDTDQALAMLERTLPVKVRRPLPWWVSIEPLEPPTP